VNSRIRFLWFELCVLLLLLLLNVAAIGPFVMNSYYVYIQSGQNFILQKCLGFYENHNMRM